VAFKESDSESAMVEASIISAGMVAGVDDVWFVIAFDGDIG
jgi:hypothetical protein